jgi:deazaflavin-dependent oxidoreductase (nitroreductase family)
MVDLPPSGTRGVELPRAIRWLIKSMGWIGSLMFRLGAKVQGRPLLRLTTKGARSGKRRETVLGWFADEANDDSLFVVASNAGSVRHPAWAFNLAKNPGDVLVDLGDGEFPVEAELLTGAERDPVWSQVVELAPGYGRYLEKTDREMPIFRLSRRTQQG